MIGTVAKRVTFREFEQVPETPGKQELMHGELIELPPPKIKYNKVRERMFLRVLAIVTEARAKGKANEFGEVHMEMGYRFEDDGWLQPDVSVTHPGQQSDGDYYLNSPALAIEVISNEKTADHVEGKIAEYLKHGALGVWVLYPSRAHLWAYRPDSTAEMYSGTFQSGLLGGAAVDLNEILNL